MALLILTEATEYYIYSNEIIEDDCLLTIVSQHTNDVLFQTTAYLSTINDRFSSFVIYTNEFEWSFDAGFNKDIDGIYNYTLKIDNNIVDYGLIKIINEDNTLPTDSFISDNEDGKSRVIYKPI